MENIPFWKLTLAQLARKYIVFYTYLDQEDGLYSLIYYFFTIRWK